MKYYLDKQGIFRVHKNKYVEFQYFNIEQGKWLEAGALWTAEELSAHAKELSEAEVFLELL